MLPFITDQKIQQQIAKIFSQLLCPITEETKQALEGLSIVKGCDYDTILKYFRSLHIYTEDYPAVLEKHNTKYQFAMYMLDKYSLRYLRLHVFGGTINYKKKKTFYQF